jgi:hypothetical protein
VPCFVFWTRTPADGTDWSRGTNCKALCLLQLHNLFTSRVSTSGELLPLVHYRFTLSVYFSVSWCHATAGALPNEYKLFFNPEPAACQTSWNVTIKIILITPPSVIKIYLYIYMLLHVSVNNNHIRRQINIVRKLLLHGKKYIKLGFTESSYKLKYDSWGNNKILSI